MLPQHVGGRGIQRGLLKLAGRREDLAAMGHSSQRRLPSQQECVCEGGLAAFSMKIIEFLK